MTRYYRRVIRIRGEDSPNVRLAEAQLTSGLAPTKEQIVLGVLSWEEYQFRRAMWDEVRQCIGLDALFWEGASVFLYPMMWLDRAERIAEGLRGRRRQARGIGIDPAEGGDKTAMTAVDELGIIEQVSKKTPDTSVITGEALAFMLRHGCPPDRVYFDRGGGGKQHADRLRTDGHPVRTVDFGEPVTPNPRWGGYKPPDQLENREERTIYLNRRAQMYDLARILLDPASVHVKDFWESITGEPGYPSDEFNGFGIPKELVELRRQLSPIPLLYDKEGKMRMLPKSKTNPESKEVTLTQLLGCSPDEADSFVIALYAMTNVEIPARIGAF